MTVTIIRTKSLLPKDWRKTLESRVRLAAPVLRKTLAPVAERPCGDAVGVQHVPAVFVGGFPAGAKPVDYAVVNDFSRWCQSRRCNGLSELFDQVVHGVLPVAPLGPIRRRRVWPGRCLSCAHWRSSRHLYRTESRRCDRV